MLFDSGLISLCDGLIENKVLKTLNISKNDITAFGAVRLKECLKTMYLYELDIGHNPLGT